MKLSFVGGEKLAGSRDPAPALSSHGGIADEDDFNFVVCWGISRTGEVKIGKTKDGENDSREAVHKYF